MRFLEKVAGYIESYNNVDNKEGIIKVAAEENVTPDDMVAYHNLFFGNMFTGEGLVKTASSNGNLVALGNMIDKVINDHMEFGDLYKEAAALGMDSEDVDTVLNSIEKQAMEAGIIANEETDEMLLSKVAEAMDYMESNGIDPMDALIIASNVTPEGDLDEKIASEAVAMGYNGNHMDIIAESLSYIGGLTDKTAAAIEMLYKEAN